MKRKLLAIIKILRSDKWLLATKKGEDIIMDTNFAPNDGITTASNGRAIYLS